MVHATIATGCQRLVGAVSREPCAHGCVHVCMSAWLRAWLCVCVARRLLEVKVQELEDVAAGTGPLEEDLRLLALHEAAATRAAAKAKAQAWQSAGAAGGQDAAAGATHGSTTGQGAQAVKGMLAPAVRSAVVYRAGQKRLARAWLARTKRELGALMRALDAAMRAQRAGTA